MARAGRKRKVQARRTRDGVARPGVEDDPRQVVMQARRRQRAGFREPERGEEARYRRWATSPASKEEMALLRHWGDTLSQLEQAGRIDAEMRAAGEDFALRYLRFAKTNGLPPRTAKGAAYGAVRGAPPEVDPEVAERAKERHMGDLAVLRSECPAGTVHAVMRVCVEDTMGSLWALKHGLQALLVHYKKR